MEAVRVRELLKLEQICIDKVQSV